MTLLTAWFLFLSPAIWDTFLHKPTFLSDLVSEYAIEIVYGVLIWTFQAFGLLMAFITHQALIKEIITIKIYKLSSALIRYAFFAIAIYTTLNLEVILG